jgi:hypothetical protein
MGKSHQRPFIGDWRRATAGKARTGVNGTTSFSLPELQSRCGNNAAVFFAWQSQQDHEARKPNTRSIVYDYKNQYSESMKGCFIVITTHAEWDEGKYSGSYKADLHRSTTYMLFDVNAELGTYFKERP